MMRFEYISKTLVALMALHGYDLKICLLAQPAD